MLVVKSVDVDIMISFKQQTKSLLIHLCNLLSNNASRCALPYHFTPFTVKPDNYTVQKESITYATK